MSTTKKELIRETFLRLLEQRPLSQITVKDIVDDYCKDPGVTLIYVTHYQEELPRCIEHALTLSVL